MMRSRTRLLSLPRWSWLFLGSLAALAVMSGLCASPARAGTTSYTGLASQEMPPGDTTNWFDPKNWSAGVPGAGDTAVIDSFTVKLNASVTVGSLILRTSNLTVPNGLAQTPTLTVTGDFQWIGSGISVNLNLPSGSTTEISGPNADGLGNNLTINAAGVTTFSTTGGLSLSGDAINNSGTFNLESDSSISDAPATAGSVFNNTGTINRSTTTGNMVIATSLSNSGTVNAQTGTLDIKQGGMGAGAFNVSTGAVLDFGSSAYTLMSGASLNGAGTLLLSNEFFPGTLMVASTATVNENIATLQLNGGGITADGTLNINSPTFNWTSGGMEGAGTINLAKGVTTTINGASDKQIGVINLNNAGTMNWADRGNITAGANSVNFNNSGSFNIQNDQTYNVTGLVINSGAITKNGTNGTTILQNLSNSGTVSVKTGTLDLQTTGSNQPMDSGAFNVSQGATLTLGTGSNTLTNGATLNGGGTLQFASDFFNGVLVVPNGVTIDDNIATLQLVGGGALAVTGTFNVNGPTFNWTDGSFNGPGGTINLSKATTTNISGAAGKPIGGETFNSAGRINWSGVGTIFLNTDTTFNNSGTFNIQNDTPIDFGTGAVLNNTGTLTKSGTAGTTTFSGPMTNSGTVNVSSGTLSTNGYTQTAGVANLNGGTLAGNVTLTGGSLTGAGTLSGNLVNGGAVSPGSGTTAGVLMITGTYTQQPGGALNIKIGGTTAGASSDEVVVGQPATLNGTLNLTLVNGFVPNNVPPFTIVSYQSETGTFSTINKPAAINGMALGVTVNPTNVTVGSSASGPLNVFQMGITLISLPYDYSATDMDAAALFGLTPEASNGFAPIAFWDPTTNKYLIYPNLPGDNGKQTMPGRGYWIYEKTPVNFNQPGDIVNSPFSEALQPGWNMIGDPFTNPVTSANLQITASVAVGSAGANMPQTIEQAMANGIIGSPFWSWDNANNQYVSQDPTNATLLPYLGYWIFINGQPTGGQNVTLTFTNPSP